MRSMRLKICDEIGRVEAEGQSPIVGRTPRFPQARASSMLAILLIAHGSKRPEANADLVILASEVRATGRFDHIEIAYLELAPPDIPTGIERCIAAGATEVRLLPYFLSMGRHVTEHLEEFRANAATANPAIRFTLCEPLGPHEKLVEIVLERIGDSP